MTEPIEIQGQIDFKIIVSEEGYTLETERSVQNDMACLIIAQDFTINGKKNLAEALKGVSDKKTKAYFEDRLNQIGRAEKGIAILIGEVSQIVLREYQVDKIKEEKEYGTYDAETNSSNTDEVRNDSQPEQN